MRPPAAVIAALQQLSHRVLCIEDCFSTCEIRYSEAFDQVVIAHPDPFCDCVVHPVGESAVALSEFVNAELSRLVLMADYGEPLPISVYAGGAL